MNDLCQLVKRLIDRGSPFTLYVDKKIYYYRPEWFRNEDTECVRVKKSFKIEQWKG